MIKPYEIVLHRTLSGKEPYSEWEESLDKSTMARIDARLARIRDTGNMGQCEPVGEGIYELKFDFGPGFRVYFGLENDTLMILLIGGSKKNQQKDINKAKEYWREYLSIKRGKK